MNTLDSIGISILLAAPFLLWGITGKESRLSKIQSWSFFKVTMICGGFEIIGLKIIPALEAENYSFYLIILVTIQIFLIVGGIIIFLRWLGQYSFFRIIGLIISYPVRKYYQLKFEAFKKGMGKNATEEQIAIGKYLASKAGVTFSLEDDIGRVADLSGLKK